MDCECGEKDLETEVVGCCSCHINPPCSACVDAPFVCRSCGEHYEIPNPPPSKWKPTTPYVKPKMRTLEDLDKSKIDWIIAREEGWYSGMVVHGYCPNGTTRDEILIALKIKSRPCMAKFKSFESGGYFKVSYFTD